MRATRVLLVAAAVSVVHLSAEAQLAIEMVNVGNLGNAGEMSGYAAGGYGENRLCGAVDYRYSISKFEITAGQYAEFLNAVAVIDDPYGLWDWYMWGSHRGCQIDRFGDPGSYWYFVPADYADRPVNWVSWGDAARFANWLTNGQPTCPQGPGTTETGSYALNGAMSDAQLMAIVREPDAVWVVPSEDEWYKAAHHANNGPTGDYFDYPTGSDIAPANDLIDPDPGNSANYYAGGDQTLGPPYYRSVFGDFENSPSPYGTFDQGGNVAEWTEGATFGINRLLRGGSYLNDSGIMHAAYRNNDDPPTYESDITGIRIALIPAAADLNGDGTVDLADLAILLADYPCSTGECPGDLDGDGDTDLADLAALLASYGS